MSNPRYRPCDRLLRGSFGLSTKPEWKPTPMRDPKLRREHDAAVMQHDWARAIRAGMGRVDLDEYEYAEAAGISLDRLQRLLRGQVVMRIEDMATAMRLLGVRPPPTQLRGT